MIFHHGWLSKCTQNQISLPSQYRKWDTVLFTSGDISIHCSWSVPKPSLNVWCRREELLCASLYLLWFSPTYVPQRLTHKLQKIQDVWISPLSTKMACQYEEERHSLIMKCLKTILRYMRQMEGALDSICLSIIGPTEPFSTKVGSQIACKMPHFGYHLSTENILWDVELQLKWEISIAYEVFQNHP